MAIDTYAALIDAIPRWLNKRTLDGRAADFLRLAETDFESKLRTREMQKSVEADVDCPAVTLPSDWLEASRLSFDGASEPLKFATLVQILSLRGQRGDSTAVDLPGWPTHYGFNDNMIEFAPAPTGLMKLRMMYYARVPRLTAAAPTNWLTVRDPGVYLYGALTQASPYLVDDDRVATWSREYNGRIQQLNASSQIALHSGGPLRRRMRGFGRSRVSS
jgi:hypothetical protein